MKLYDYLPSGNSYKVRLLLAYLGKPYTHIPIDIHKGETLTPKYLALNPAGQIPLLQMDDGRVLAESNAILTYLAESTDYLPTDKYARAKCLQWMFFEQSKLEPFISPARFFNYIVPSERDARADDIAGWQDAAKPGLDRLNTHLTGRKFMLASGYSIADIALFGYVHVLDEAGLSLADYPMIARWIDDVSKTERFKPLNQLGIETQRAA